VVGNNALEMWLPKGCGLLTIIKAPKYLGRKLWLVTMRTPSAFSHENNSC
jgi:hypothetical protein